MNKKDIYHQCLLVVRQKLADTELAIREAQRAANEETKSSVGDKYETGRAMMHLEQEKLAGQQAAAQRLLKTLHGIHPERASNQVRLGSLVSTNQGYFYLAVGLGQVSVDSATCFVISPVAPLGQALRGKQAGDTVQLNGRLIRINEVR